MALCFGAALFLACHAEAIMPDYDAVGNRRTRTVNNLSVIPSVTGSQYDANDRLEDFSGPSGTVDYSYDANGNTIGVNLNNASAADDIRDEYDYENRLILRKIGPLDALGRATKEIQFAYDADGNRVSKTVREGGTTTTHLRVRSIHYAFRLTRVARGIQALPVWLDLRELNGREAGIT